MKLNLAACTNAPSISQNISSVILTPMDPNAPANLTNVTKNIDGSFTILIFSSDPGLINKKLRFRLDFTDLCFAVNPPLNPYFVITAKCIVKQAYQTNITQPSFEYKIGQAAVGV